jgi:hypothetical protein
LSSHAAQFPDVVMKHIYYIYKFLAAVLLSAALVGCSGSESPAKGEFLIRVGEAVITEVEFNKAFEIAKAAYPHNIMQNPEDYREAQSRLFNQMTEGLLLLERARELNISVSEEEVEKSIARIKADYPDNEVFEQTLLEYAVSYKTWKKGLETRLLMEKLVEQELKDQIVITPAEIAKYYKENYGHDEKKTGPAENSKEIDEIIVKHLRRKKTEKIYRSWLEKIQKRYKIEINQKKWEKILSS